MWSDFMKKINVLIDASGSMNEDGKLSALKYLLYTMLNIIKEQYNDMADFEFVQWSTEVTKLEKLNMLTAEDNLNENKLYDYFKLNSPDAVIFISDGNFNVSLRSAILSIAKEIFVVSIGLDSDEYNLKMVSSNSSVYKACDIEQVIKNCFLL